MKQPNSVADAARLLQQFVSGEHLSAGSESDDRATLIAAQLLAIATQLERIANAQEAAAKSLITFVGVQDDSQD